ncbi:DUF4232 domain-containing protein [Saccharopolyspora dendranthemae]|uniref:DUF4232 domain-containing protein n=1 Tax=Saccharopolyspora dendranthemae TaxID=1181886 RepID=UPI001644357F|nr:DUF4232 domain-containing protein [Saccharopolyspora dendranthemae]
MLEIRGKRLGALIAATAAVTVSCGQQAPQAQQPPAVVTVTQPAPEQTSEAQESSEGSSEETSGQSGFPEGNPSDPEEIPTQKPCKASELRARFYPESILQLNDDLSQPTDGYRVKLRLANVGAKACTIEGDPRFEFIDPNGGVKPATTQVVAGAAPFSAMSIGTREGVSQDIQWKSAPGDCVYSPPKINIYPDGSDEPIAVEWSFGSVCGDLQLQTTHLHSD